MIYLFRHYRHLDRATSTTGALIRDERFEAGNDQSAALAIKPALGTLRPATDFAVLFDISGRQVWEWGNS